MSFKIETISEPGTDDYEIWTCEDCGHSYALAGVGGGMACCPYCMQSDEEIKIKYDDWVKFIKTLERW